MKLMILGATGAVGREVMAQALASGRFAEVVAPTRRPLPAHRGLVNPVWPMTVPLPDSPHWSVDGVICCLGTTLRKAGSREAFRVVDETLVLAAARKAWEAGARTFVLNSSMGADPGAPAFYLQVKGRVEQQLKDMDFERLVLVRPSLIDAEREEFRPAEWLGRKLSRVVRPLIPDRYKPVTPEAIAHAMLAALEGPPGVEIIENAEIINGG
ncbi:oxidoreductase [Hahella sp. SMD15-11]|uniref:Oxidoreductase n=1 Tax=Thermohahella caldifontis TaxID=3142973 RepID=A0AB39UVA5_9GAMM